MNKKLLMGMRLRRLRAQRGMSQSALAQALGLSPSYVNQIEQNQRPLTAAVLLRLGRALGVDVQQFSGDEEARLAAALQEALADAPEAVTWPEIQEVAEQMPALAHAVLALHRRCLHLSEQVEALAQCVEGGGRQGDGTALAPLHAAPYEAVRDFFFAHHNYFDALDRAAESLAEEAGVRGALLAPWLEQRLQRRHGVQVVRAAGDALPDKRRFDPAARQLTLAARLAVGQQAFQMATQLALLELDAQIDALAAAAPGLADAQARRLARIGLANYAAGALLLPYSEFQSAAESLRHDIELLGQRFGMGFETICHRLSTMQRPGAPGIPFFFVRVDRAGNISKRQSATHFHFSRTGGACPLWNVYEAFEQRGRILVQLAAMPDGRRYLWIARSVAHGQPGWGRAQQQFSIGLGCDVRYAHRLVYARGLDLKDPHAATPIGMGCRVCERSGCPQRAFPFAARALQVDENASGFAPYGGAESAN